MEIDLARFWTSDTLVAAIIGATGTIVAGLAGVWLTKALARKERQTVTRDVAVWQIIRKQVYLSSMDLEGVEAETFWRKAEFILGFIKSYEDQVPSVDRNSLKLLVEFLERATVQKDRAAFEGAIEIGLRNMHERVTGLRYTGA